MLNKRGRRGRYTGGVGGGGAGGGGLRPASIVVAGSHSLITVVWLIAVDTGSGH